MLPNAILYLRIPQPGILDGPSSIWIYARVQKFWPRKKPRLRWLTQICNFAAPNNNIFFNRRGFIQQNKPTKHPLSIDVSNIKPLASGHHNFEETKWQHGQPLVRVSKDHTSSIYLHYTSHTTLTGFAAKSSQSLVHPWKQLSPVSQNKMDCFFWK